MAASRNKLKIYATNYATPSDDARTLVGAHREDFGSFLVYVAAPSKLKASLAIKEAFQGSGADINTLRVAATSLDTAHGDDLDALIRAGLFTDDGDVVVTDEQRRAHVVRVAAAAEADGDPQLVGSWETARDADDYPVNGFKRASDGAVFAEPIDELHKTVVLEDRARKAAQAAAITNVRDFLAARRVLTEAPRTTIDPEYIASVGTNDSDRETGRIDLTVADLTILLGLAEGHR
jgi:hypothetical protein